MKVCLVCLEIFAWGKYGGFGRSTRMLGRELVKRGIEVTAVVPRREGQGRVEELDGMTVLSFPTSSPWTARRLFRECDADIYHSQQPSFSTYLALQSMPDRKHLITFRDPKPLREWLVELRYPSISHSRTFLWWLYESAFTRTCVRKADGVFGCAPGIGSRVKQIYGLDSEPQLLPSPIEIPNRPMRKSDGPSVCFLSRWDRRKRPELFFRMAAERPHVNFVAIGSGQDLRRDGELRARYGKLPNVEIPGFIDQFSSDSLSEVLERSWVLVNTAAREGLPTSFLEALAHRCALLSHVNPDGLAERFGMHVQGDEFGSALDRLLENETWRARGEAGQSYVKEHYELEAAIDQHNTVYQAVLAGRALHSLAR